jgi:hypothetical protein
MIVAAENGIMFGVERNNKIGGPEELYDTVLPVLN